MLRQISWTRYSMESQGFQVNESVLHQDTLSAMIPLPVDVQAQLSKCDVSNRIKSKEIFLEHKPTNTMLGNFFTKSLHEIKFITVRRQIIIVESGGGSCIPPNVSLRVMENTCRSML